MIEIMAEWAKLFCKYRKGSLCIISSLHPVPKCGCGGNRGHRYPDDADGREAQPQPALLRVIGLVTQCCRSLR